jgi:alkylation response protein AidB-like acyl-CoA dehydrogenase
MHMDFTDEQRALQHELREYFGSVMTPEWRAQLGSVGDEVGSGSVYHQIFKRLAADGWLGVGWPKEYGGQGYGPVEQLIFLEEAARANCPIPMITLNTVGPTLAQWGTDEQKERFLPAILQADVSIAIGYTEPGAGTDLASLRTRAVRDGDEYIVNGQKVFTSDGDVADYIWLACRTDPDAPKHKGISILLVDTTSPGFKSTPIWTVAGGHTNATYYEDVRVPVSMRVGEENGGWKMITTQLNFERVALGPAARIMRSLDAVIDWAKHTTTPDGTRVADLEWVRINLARVRAKVEACDLFNWRIASLQEHGTLNPADASALKVYGTELRIEALRLLMEVVGPQSTLQKGSPGAALAGQLEVEYRGAIVGTFGGGVNEIQREIVASVGLGTPRVPR